MTIQQYEIRPSSPLWPQALNELDRPPECLYVRGDPTCLTDACISIIGARKATSYGLAVAEMAGRVSAECGICVVSGAAMGCDYVASRAALNAGGKTILVVATGADGIYPLSSKDIYDDVLHSSGAIVSMFPWGTEPLRRNFVLRNALIAALSSCLIVTEAGKRSGTMITAQNALDLGRHILAIPGSIFSPTSSGTNALIRDGANMVSDERDLEMAISLLYGKLRLVDEEVSQSFGDILSSLMASPSRPQELAERLNRDVLTILKTLSDFELQGFVYRLPDGRFAPTKDFLLAHRTKSLAT